MEKTLYKASITSRITGQDPIYNRSEARYYIRGGEAHLMYKLQIAEDETPITESLTVRFEGEEILWAEVKRPSGFLLRFQEKEAYTMVYPTPAGDMDVKIETTLLKGTVKEDLLKLDIGYQLVLGNDPQGSTRITYTVTK